MVPAAASEFETESSVVLEVDSLPFRRLWNSTVYAHNCEEHPLTIGSMELGEIITCTCTCT